MRRLAGLLCDMHDAPEPLGIMSSVLAPFVRCFNTSSNGSRERPPAELNKVVVLPWFCECNVWSELRCLGGVWEVSI